MPLRIAPLTGEDLPDARALALLAEVRPGPAAQWEADLAAPSRMLLGAWHGDRLVGVATAAVGVDDADVLLVAVAPDQRRRGIGRALTSALLDACAASGLSRVLLEVRAANRAARALYAGLGFAEVARRGSYYRDGEDAIVLARDLRAAGPR